MLEVLYPEKCMVCGKITREHMETVCFECARKLPYIRGMRCAICSKAVSNDIGVCNDCRKREHVFKQGFGLFAYDKTLEKIVAGVKYSKKWHNLEWLTKELVYHAELCMKRWQPQLIIPVPLYNSKLRTRGFNQAAIIAKEIASGYDIHYEDNMLLRIRKTKPQKQLNDDERYNNLKDAFCINEAVYKRYGRLNSVVVVDDIYTTGSTIDMCAELLKNAGVAEVYFLTLCVGEAY